LAKKEEKVAQTQTYWKKKDEARISNETLASKNGN